MVLFLQDPRLVDSMGVRMFHKGVASTSSILNLLSKLKEEESESWFEFIKFEM